eukprot:1113947-Amphidinium_carterae.1
MQPVVLLAVLPPPPAPNHPQTEPEARPYLHHQVPKRFTNMSFASSSDLAVPSMSMTSWTCDSTTISANHRTHNSGRTILA